MTRKENYLFPLLVFVGAFVLMWYRAPLRMEHGFLWAEDAVIFMAQANELGRHSFFQAYAGYWHFVPRLVAWLQVKTTPLSDAPYFFMWTCALITAISSAYMAHAFRVFSRPVAGLLSLAPLLVPQSGEILLNITNLQWILFPVLLVLLWENLFNPPESGYFVRGLAAASLSLTGPFGIISLLPAMLASAYAWRRGPFSRRQIGFFLAYLASVAGQIYAVKTETPRPLDFGAQPYLVRYCIRFVREIFVGFFPSPDSVPTIAGVVLIVALVFVVVRSRVLWACLLLGVMAAVIWLLGAARSNSDFDHMMWWGFGSRYIYPAMLFAFWAALLSIETTTSAVARKVAGGLVIFILLASATRFQAQEWPMWEITHSDAGYALKIAPNWTAQIPDPH